MKIPTYQNCKKIERLIAPEAIKNDHVVLITPADFFRIQLDEINQFIKAEGNPSNINARDNLAQIWIMKNAKDFQSKWRPFIMPAAAIIEARYRINDHRWIESEKAQQDLHWLAEFDWLITWGEAFINYWKEIHPKIHYICSIH